MTASSRVLPKQTQLNTSISQQNHQLPSYSPDFNPIEHLWKAVRDDATHNKYFAQFEQVVDSVENTLRFLVRHHKQVRQILGDYAKLEDIMPKAA